MRSDPPTPRAAAAIAGIFLAVLPACPSSDGHARSEATSEAVKADPWGSQPAPPPCEAVAGFATELALPEASGATWLQVDGAPALLVVGDSGTAGAYTLVDPDRGEVRERGALPLGQGAGDDLEGITAAGERVVGITSAGWVRVWKRRGTGFALVDGPYPIAAVDKTLKRSDHGTSTESLACSAVNCGKNYEGVCLRPAVPAGDVACAGFAASRFDGRLWCLMWRGERLVADATRSIAVTGSKVLTGCDFSPDGDTLWAGTNLLGGARVYRVAGWREPATARAETVAGIGAGFPEALAVGPNGAIFRFSDTGSPTSAQGKFVCR